jgi:hypothetical protein
MNTSKIIEWYDSDTTDSLYIAANAYGLTVNDDTISQIDSDTISVEISGKTEDVERFLEDLEEGDVDPFDNTRDMSDNEYLEWLSKELQKYGKLFIPKFYPEEDDENI